MKIKREDIIMDDSDAFKQKRGLFSQENKDWYNAGFVNGKVDLKEKILKILNDNKETVSDCTGHGDDYYCYCGDSTYINEYVIEQIKKL